MIGMISHYKPINELITPILKDQKSAFNNQFAGMTLVDFSYEDYEKTRATLIENIQQRLTDNDKKFLLSFEKGEPEWDLFPHSVLKDLPAIKWKLLNIKKLKKTNPKKHEQMIIDLKKALGMEDI